MKKAKGTSYLFGCQTPTDKIEACHHLYYRMYEYRNYIIRTTFCLFRTVTKSCPVETVPACPVQIRAHRHIAVYIDSNNSQNAFNVIWLSTAIYSY